MKFWDLLSHRYANPFPVVNLMIQNGALCEFITQMLEQIDEERFWQLYLSRALLEERSFKDWRAAACTNSKVQEKQEQPIPVEIDVKATVQNAENILQNFKPF